MSAALRDLLADPDAEDRDCFVAHETDVIEAATMSAQVWETGCG